MPIQPWVTLIKDIVTGLAAATAAVIGVLGLRTWKAQLKGKTEYETARSLLRCVYRVRDAMRVVRNPFQGGG
jgi:type IV secretory pathway VirB2 component (pilin)